MKYSNGTILLTLFPPIRQLSSSAHTMEDCIAKNMFKPRIDGGTVAKVTGTVFAFLLEHFCGIMQTNKSNIFWGEVFQNKMIMYGVSLLVFNIKYFYYRQTVFNIPN